MTDALERVDLVLRAAAFRVSQRGIAQFWG
jgi:hypothetical protein